MKTRRRASKHFSERIRRRKEPLPRQQAPARPSLLVLQARDVGALLVGKPLHKDLANLELALEIPSGMEITAGDFLEGRPVGGRAQRVEVLRKIDPAGAASWAAVLNHNLHHEWDAAVLREAKALKPYAWSPKDKRVDLRTLPFVTIDGADARDFDDAVWAEQIEAKRGKPGGFRAIVAIADVAHYVTPGSLLDAAARERGNSTYFPDRVLPMLPERLSNDLCSLRPREDRPVLAVEMRISPAGELEDYTFFRAVIHSHARLTYDEVEDGWHSGKGGGVDLTGLIGVYEALLAFRLERGALDLDIPEVKIELKKDGSVANVGVRPRLKSNRLIEELMIAANVAAADYLSKHGGGLYRVHGEPSREKLMALKATLGPLGFTVPAPNANPKAWARLVGQINGHPAAQTLLRAVLQTQQQAKYDPDNIGHYGLALPLYTHFTSPIRRYADLLVHRFILRVAGSQDVRMSEEACSKAAGHINETERRSQMAEWEARDRMVAQHFTGLVGKTFPAVVVSVQPFGCFVAVEGVAEGLLPKWLLGDGWAFIGSLNCYRKTRGGKGVLRVGTRLDVHLREADPLGGRLTFGLPRQPA